MWRDLIGCMCQLKKHLFWLIEIFLTAYQRLKVSQWLFGYSIIIEGSILQQNTSCERSCKPEPEKGLCSNASLCLRSFGRFERFLSHRQRNHQMFKPDARTWKVSRAITTRREVILWFRALLCSLCEVPYTCPFYLRILWEGHYWGVPAVWGNGVSLSKNMFWLLEGSYNGPWQQLQELQVRIIKM